MIRKRTSPFEVPGVEQHFNPKRVGESLRQVIPVRPRSKRALVEECLELSISQLKALRMLDVGRNHRRLYRGMVVTTFLKGRRTFVRWRVESAVITLELEARRLGYGLNWYFIHPGDMKLIRAVRFSPKGELSSVPPLYASQFQSKMHRRFVQMTQLILDIEGDYYDRRGPGRGSKRLQRLKNLKRIFEWVRSEQLERKRMCIMNPDLKGTYILAKALLKKNGLFVPNPRKQEKIKLAQLHAERAAQPRKIPATAGPVSGETSHHRPALKSPLDETSVAGDFPSSIKTSI